MSNEITKDNILEVLEFNKSLGLKVDNIRIEDNCICFNFNGYKQEFEFDDDGDTKWLQHTEIETGKLKPLPKANPFDVVKVGDWIKSKKTLYHYQCQLPYRTKDKWYQRVELNNKKCFVCNSNGPGYSSSDSPCDWDLTDIRDYNPTEYELKIGDVTTTENMVKINPHNYLIIIGFDYTNQSVLCKYSITNNKLDTPITTFNETGIYIINGKKYDKITIPPFDFAKCLIDAGFIEKDGVLFDSTGFITLIIGSNTFYLAHKYAFIGQNKQLTPANAKILIELAKLAKGLK